MLRVAVDEKEDVDCIVEVDRVALDIVSNFVYIWVWWKIRMENVRKRWKIVKRKEEIGSAINALVKEKS